MSPQLWGQVRDLFHQVLDLPVEERERIIALDADPAVRQEVHRLLSQITGSPGLLDRPLLYSAPPPNIVAERFRITRLIGRGGMGEVFEALDLSLDVPVALKTIAPEWLHDALARERFKAEVQSARRVTHRNVCRLFDYIESPSGPSYVAMELLAGDTISAIVERDGPLALGRAQAILGQILDGLESIHNAGIIHRDLKPNNIILVPDAAAERAVILDFGLARSIEAGPVHTSRIVGTVSYMAPEQFQGESTIQSDIYALGLVAHFLVTGRLPAQGVQPPGVWAAAIQGCTAASPAQRFGSIGAVRQAFFPNPVFSRRAIAAGIAVAATAAGSTFYFTRPADLSTMPGAILALAPLHNQTSDKDLDSIDSLLSAQLGQSSHLRSLDRSALPATIDPAGLRQSAIKNGAALLLFTQAAGAGERYQLTFILEHLASRRTSRLTTTVNGRQAIYQSIRQAARWVRRSAGEPASEIAELDSPPEDATTPSWPALTAFHRAQRESAANRREQALLILDEAIRHDPDFCLAHMRKGDLLLSLSRDDQGFRAWKSAIDLTTRRHIGKKEEFRIRSMYLADTWQYAEAVRSYETFALYFPREREAFQWRARPLALLGRVKESVETLQQAAAIDPEAEGPRVSLALHAAIHQDFTQAWRLLRALPNSVTALHVSAVTAFIQSDYAAVSRHFTEALKLASPPVRSRLIVHYVNLLAELGAIDLCLATLDIAIGADRDLGLFLNMQWKIMSRFALQLRVPNQSKDMPIELLTSAGPWLRAECVALLARAGHVPRAREIAAAFSPALDIPAFRYAAARMRGELDLAAGNFPAAIGELSAAANALPPNWPKEFLAYAYEQAGRRGEAAAAYLAAVRCKAILWHTSTPHRPGIWRDSLAGLLRTAPAADWQIEFDRLRA